MKLILIRHGKAEKITPGMEDTDRPLTSDGRKAFTKSIPGLKLLIGDRRNIRLWSSPLKRATQSAIIIADAFGIKEPEIFDFISEGDYTSLSTELAKMESEANDDPAALPDCLILVGHQPLLSAWCQAISRDVIHFEIGGAVGINILSLTASTGTVEWSVNKKRAKGKNNRSLLQSDLKNARNVLNPIPKMMKNEPAIGEIIKILQFYLHETQNVQRQFLEEPAEIENLHQLRVNIRKFRSFLSFMRTLLDHEDYKKNQEKMRSAGQQFSYLRELDVLQDEWNKIVSKRIAEIPNPSKLNSILKEEREKEQARLQHLLAEGTLTTILVEVGNWLNDVKTAHDAKSEKSLETYAADRIKRWQNEINKELKKVETYDLSKLHLLRIKSKKLRYIQEIFIKNNADNHNAKYVDHLKDLQEELGTLRDTQRNLEMIHKLFSANKSRTVSLERNIFIGYLLGKEDGLHLSSSLSKLSDHI